MPVKHRKNRSRNIPHPNARLLVLNNASTTSAATIAGERNMHSRCPYARVADLHMPFDRVCRAILDTL